ncbi:hypothetical protein BDB01DRAFT_809726 [Pilobolus umbonatus]|nr:hypothetical protein BDB01DRAFT_809726 [Pilobolus umbonatus]
MISVAAVVSAASGLAGVAGAAVTYSAAVILSTAAISSTGLMIIGLAAIAFTTWATISTILAIGAFLWGLLTVGFIFVFGFLASVTTSAVFIVVLYVVTFGYTLEPITSKIEYVQDVIKQAMNPIKDRWIYVKQVLDLRAIGTGYNKQVIMFYLNDLVGRLCNIQSYSSDTQVAIRKTDTNILSEESMNMEAVIPITLS